MEYTVTTMQQVKNVLYAYIQDYPLYWKKHPDAARTVLRAKNDDDVCRRETNLLHAMVDSECSEKDLFCNGVIFGKIPSHGNLGHVL